MVKCDKCQKDAVTYIRYNGSHLCQGHFSEFVEKRVKKEIRNQTNFNKVKNVAVAISGGKDSRVALSLMHSVVKERRDVTLTAITVDEGIENYRPETIKCVRELCDKLDVTLEIVSFKDHVGYTMDDISKNLGYRTPCAFCGVFRRQCMNAVARNINADIIATGHNLDDNAQAILMNFTRGDVERLARLSPHVRIQPGLIPRIHPLRQIPEKETYLYAIINEIPFSDKECPYWSAALRNEYRDIIDELESRSPGTRHSILSSYDAIKPLLIEKYPQKDLGKCKCGEPSPSGKCMACKMLEDLNKK